MPQNLAHPRRAAALAARCDLSTRRGRPGVKPPVRQGSHFLQTSGCLKIGGPHRVETLILRDKEGTLSRQEVKRAGVFGWLKVQNGKTEAGDKKLQAKSGEASSTNIHHCQSPPIVKVGLTCQGPNLGNEGPLLGQILLLIRVTSKGHVKRARWWRYLAPEKTPGLNQ